MYDCHKDITDYHNDAVNLTSSQIEDLRKKRDANRQKLKKGIKVNNDLTWDLIKSQGSYQMRTMVQSTESDFDIDDGVYFKKSDLVGAGGVDKSALDARKMVCDAVKDPHLTKEPEIRNHCVRIEYKNGSHIDIPVYRLDDDGEDPELASTDWMRSDARDVTEWFTNENKTKSLDKDSNDKLINGGQLRRIVRLIKTFARSRNDWKGSILSGFGITILACECYQPDASRDDVALYYTLKKMCERLSGNLEIKHPKTIGAKIADVNDARANKFKTELCDKMEYLNPLFDHDCNCEKAMKCWKKFFKTDFFNDRCDDEKGKKFAATVAKKGGNGGYAYTPNCYWRF